MHIAVYSDGVVTNLSWPECAGEIASAGPFPLCIADPPYGEIVDSKWDRFSSEAQCTKYQFDSIRALEPLMVDGGAVYWWGGYGKPGFRPFFQVAAEIEHCSDFNIAALITWHKKRAYGVQHNYLSTREEALYLVKGDIKKPHKFNIPLLDEKAQKGWNPKYPTKSEFKRRPMVWNDVSDMMQNKLHECHKPSGLFKIMIETHTDPGDIVLDLYSGSGECAVTARQLGRRFLSIENDRQTFEKIVERLGPPTQTL